MELLNLINFQCSDILNIYSIFFQLYENSTKYKTYNGILCDIEKFKYATMGKSAFNGIFFEIEKIE